MRLINADALKKDIKSYFLCCMDEHDSEIIDTYCKEILVHNKNISKIIKEAPTVEDVVQVVRCKDCENSRGLNRKDPLENFFVENCVWCMVHGNGYFEDDFCSYGKRRGEGE